MVNFPFLKPQLLLVVHRLKLAAAAGSGHRAFRLYPPWGRLQHLDQPGKSIGFLHFHHASLCQVANHRIFNEPGIPFCPANPQSFITDIFNPDLNPVIFLPFHHPLIFFPRHLSIPFHNFTPHSFSSSHCTVHFPSGQALIIL